MPDNFELKQLSATIGVTGSVGMFYMKDAKAKDFEDAKQQKTKEKIEIEKRSIEEFYEKSESEEPDVIAIGCPHCSSDELKYIYNLLKRGGRIREDFFIFTAKAIKRRNENIVQEIEKLGVKVFCDTCFVVFPTF